MSNAQQFGFPNEAIRLIHSQASSDINKFLKKTLGNALIQFIDNPLRPSSPQKQSQQSIKANFIKINKIVDQIENHLQHRFQNYQTDILAVVKQQIEQMNIQTKRLVSSLHQKIQEKEQNQELWYIRNQNDFFKSEAMKLYQTNKDLRLQIIKLKQTIKDYEIIFEANDSTLQKLKKKELKHKFSMKLTLQQLQSQHKFPQRNLMKINKLRIRERLQTQASKKLFTEEGSERQEFQPKSTIKLQNNSIGVDILNDNISIPSFSYHTQPESQSKFQIKKIQSQQEIQSIRQQRGDTQKMDKSTQTNMNFTLKLNLHQKGNSVPSENDNEKNINIQRSGFVLNGSNKIRRQSIFRKSIDCQVEQSNRDAVQMHKSLVRNKLSINYQRKPTLQRALFKSSK